jgi:ABC-type multidrug transport system ATPase subunit
LGTNGAGKNYYNQSFFRLYTTHTSGSLKNKQHFCYLKPPGNQKHVAYIPETVMLYPRILAD